MVWWENNDTNEKYYIHSICKYMYTLLSDYTTSMTVCRILSRWGQKGQKVRHPGPQRTAITNRREDKISYRYVTTRTCKGRIFQARARMSHSRPGPKKK